MRRWMNIVLIALFVGSVAFPATAQPEGAGAIADLHEAEADASESPSDVAESPVEDVTDEAPSDTIEDVEEATADVDEDTGVPDVDEYFDDTTEPEIGDIAGEAPEVFSIWKTHGWIAGLAFLIYLLVQITKVKVIKEWLIGVRKWLRPLIAVVLGAAGAVFALAAGGVVWWEAVVGGLVAALGSSGFHELMNSLTPKGREKRTGEATDTGSSGGEG